MNKNAMEPFGQALLAYHAGDTTANLIIRRDDGVEATLPVSHFFRDEALFNAIEKTATDLCRGHVLDIGAGTGSVSLSLQQKGNRVTAIDICPQAVFIARQLGVTEAVCADVYEFKGGPFNTLLMMGHGIGMVETIEGLNRFLVFAHPLITGDGQLLIDSLDVRLTDNPENLAYHEANRKTGRYIGEIRMQFRFKRYKGPYFGWLQVDAETLRNLAEQTGWETEIILQEQKGEYLARLTRRN